MIRWEEDYGFFKIEVEIAPAPLSAWRPWPGRWSRWWIECGYLMQDDDEVSDVWRMIWTHDIEYDTGAFTLAGAIRKGARQGHALFKELYAEVKG